MKRCKRALSWLLICAMLLTLIPDRAYAMELQGVPATEEAVTESTEEGMTTETTTETTTEQEAATETVTEQSTEEEITEAATTETVTESTAEEVTTQEIVAETEQTVEVPETAVQEQVAAKEQTVKVGKVRMKNAKAASTSGKVEADGSWGDGYTWYIMSGGQKHYIFCIDHGMEMHSGVYTPTQVTGTLWDSGKNTFRVAVAMDYFQLQGGFSSPNGYEDAQRVVWNIGGTDTSNKLINYANNLYNLKYGGTSYSSSLTPVSGKGWDVVSKAALKQKKVKYEGKKVKDQTVGLSGTAWKYFAAGADGWGSIKVAAVYDASGNNVKDDVDISLSGSGNLKCSFDKSYAPDASHPLTVVMKVDGTYGGDTQIHYLDCGQNKQRLTFDANYNSNVFFAIQLYTDKTPDKEGARVCIKKVDEFGKAISGAQFELKYISGAGYDAYVSPYADDPDSGYFPEITTAGTYQLSETVTPPGMRRSMQTLYINATVVNVDGVDQIQLSPLGIDTLGDWITMDATSTSIDLQLTAVNWYKTGSASIHKVGEMIWGWNGTEFVTIDRQLENVTFKLYAADDITLQNGDVLFPAGTEITQDVLNASIWNTQGEIITYRRKPATITTTTGQDGYIKYSNLPAGNYYVIEQSTASGYVQDLSRNDFTIVAGKDDTRITNSAGAATGDLVNKGDVASVYVKKIEKSLEKNDQKKEEKLIAGAEFTLYMKVSSKNPDGDYFFSASDTVPAVVARDPNGTPTYEYNTWVPLKTASSDSNGYVDFGLKIPAYIDCAYMVTETKPADGYCYANSDEDGNLQGRSSYMWTYNTKGEKVLPDGTVEGSQADAANGKVFYITETNDEQHNFILIQKNGELLYDATTEETDYGTYRKLNFKSLSAKDIVFEIRDKDGKVIEKLTTGEDGTAKSSNLKPGTYYVYEISTDPALKLDTEPKEVVIKDDKTVSEQVETVEFMNESLPTKLHIYKQGEEVSLSETKVNGVSSSDAVYTYKKVPLAGAVFGVYAKTDITNYNGTVIVKAGSCVGYTVTDEKGIATLDSQLVSGEYYYKEIKTASKSYIRDTKVYPFTLTLEGDAVDMDINKDEPVVNEWYKGNIKVIKTDADTKQTLAGVGFTLFDENKAAIASFVTDEKGEIFIDRLPIGKYYLQENSTLENYVLDDRMQEIDLTSKNLQQVLQIENSRYKGSIKVIKTDGDTKQPLKGVEFTLYNGSQDKIGSYKTDKNGEILIEDLALGTYYLQETQTLKGYALDDQMREINLTKDNLDQVLEIENDRIEEDTSITVSTNTTIDGFGHVKTGDWISRILMLLMALSVMAFMMLYQLRSGRSCKMKKVRSLLLLVLLGMLIPAGSARAAGNMFVGWNFDQANRMIVIAGKESPNVTAELVTITTDRTSGERTIQKMSNNYSPNGYKSSTYELYLALYDSSGDLCFLSSSPVFTVDGSGVTDKHCRDFAMLGNGKVPTANNDNVPDIQIKGNLRCSFKNKDYSNQEKISTKELDISGDVTTVDMTDSHQIEVPENSSVEEICFYRDITINELLGKRMTVRDRDTKISISLQRNLNGSNTIYMTQREYEEYQYQLEHNIKVWYQGVANFRLEGYLRDVEEYNKRVVLHPGCFTAPLHSELNGGQIGIEGRNPDGYIIGGPTGLVTPERHNYEFAGWYASQYCTADTKCRNNVLNTINCPDVDSGEPLSVYAKWKFHVETEKNGISYVIGENKLATVTSGTGNGDLQIPEYLVYEGEKYPVTEIAEGAFKDQKMDTVRIPKSIQMIGEDAFSGTGLTEVYMDSDTVSLGNAFPKSVHLTAASKSAAYLSYEKDGYTGTKTALSSKISYELDGGTNSTQNPGVYEWKSTLILKDATKEGYRFDGWFTDASFKKDSRITKIYGDTYSDITLYAKFTPLKSDAGVAGDQDVTKSNENQSEEQSAPNVIKVSPEKKKHEAADMSAVTIAEVKAVKLLKLKGQKLRIQITGENADGYEIRYAVKKSMKKAKTVTVKVSSTTVAKTIKHLKKGRTYYVRVRAYSYDTKGNIVYGRWYQVKKAKIKK